jgi:putative ABC transport system ATP-binding protein
MDPHAPASPRPIIDARGLCRRHPIAGGAVEALRGVDLQVARGEFVAVMGASGSGKSTLLHLLAGLDRPDAGTVLIDGIDLGGLDDGAATLLRRRRIGVVFQAFNLLAMLSARENVALPLLLDGVPRRQALDRADAALAEVGLAERTGHAPSQLSGGEQQRVAIARALVGDADLLLADEPTGNLDSRTAVRLTELLLDLHRRGRTIVAITHDPRFASAAGRIAVIADGLLRGWIPGGDPVRAASEALAMAGSAA